MTKLLFFLRNFLILKTLFLFNNNFIKKKVVDNIFFEFLVICLNKQLIKLIIIKLIFLFYLFERIYYFI